MWVKLDDGFTDHPKIMAVGPMAAWLHVCALCYCGRFLTDGEVPKVQVRKLADVKNPDKLAGALVDAGLWFDAGNAYLIHDYLDYNPTREKVEQDREAARQRAAKRGRKGGVVSGEVRANFAEDSKPRPGPSRRTSSAHAGGDRSSGYAYSDEDDYDDRYDGYPQAAS